jgi:hypothetical protein
MSDIIYYIYRITNKIENKHYYGFRKTKFKPVDDLGIRYFSSSRNKEFISDQKQNPQHYRYKIIKTYKTRNDALRHEILLHEKFDVAANHSFYNIAKQTSTSFSTAGSTISEEHKRKIAESNRKRIYGKTSAETRRKQSEAAKRRGPVSEETRMKLSAIHKGREFTKERCENISKAKKGKPGKPIPDEVKKKMSEAAIGRVFSDEHKNNIVKSAKMRPPRSKEHRKNLSQSIKEAYEKKIKLEGRLTGEKCANFGRIWVTDGANNKSLKPNESIPDGFYRGRNVTSKTTKTQKQ